MEELAVAAGAQHASAALPWAVISLPLHSSEVDASQQAAVSPPRTHEKAAPVVATANSSRPVAISCRIQEQRLLCTT